MGQDTDQPLEEYLQALIQSIDRRIAKHSSKEKSYKLYAAANSFIARGHRYRSIVGIEMYRLFGGDRDILDAMVGVEFIHHASLIFDDLPCMDNARFRKNIPPLHLRYGESTAILTALSLIERGRSLIVENAYQLSLSTREIICLSQLIYETNRMLVEGQEVDLRKRKTDKQLWESMRKKNGAFYLAVLVSYYSARSSQPLHAIEKIGRQLAFCYQLFDDLRDVRFDQSTTGKQAGGKRSKNTSVSRFGEDIVARKLGTTKKALVGSIKGIKANRITRVTEIIEYILTTPS